MKINRPEDNKDITKGSDAIFEKLSTYKVGSSAIIILIGFIYLQGLFSNYAGSFSFTNLFMGVTDIPVSIDVYITCGLIFISSLLIQIIISYIIINITSNIRVALKLYMMDHHNKNSPPQTSIFTMIKPAILINFTLPAFCAQIYYFLFERLHSQKLIWLWVFNIVFIVVLMSSLSTHLRYKSHFTEKRQQNLYTVSKLFLMLSIALSSLSIVYYNGHISQDIKLSKILRGNSGFDFVKVYFTDSSKMPPKGYYKLSLTKDYFVGYDSIDKKSTIIPVCNIKAIENWNAVDPVKFPQKYITNTSFSQIESSQDRPSKEAAVNVIESFYKYRTGNLYGKSTNQINAEKVVKLFTSDYYKNNFHSLNPDILNKKWALSNEYNSKNLKDFCGFELSIPESNCKGGYDIYVMEVWKSFNEHLKYSLIKVNGSWYIDNIDTTCMPFEFSTK